MEKSFGMVVCAMLLLMACTGQKGAAQGKSGVEDSLAADTAFAVSDTLLFESVELVDSMAYKVKVVDYSGDEEPYPYTFETVTDYYKLSTLKAVAGKPEVVEFINQWLTISAAGEYMEEPVTAANVAKRYARLKKEGFTDVRSAFKRASEASLGENAGTNDDEEGLMEMGYASANEWDHNVYVHWVTPTLLTVWKSGYDYSAGAAHEIPWNFGLTFDLKNLRLLTYDDILKKDGRAAVLKMVIAELQGEYGEDENLLDAPESIELPGNDPALEAEGVRFDYGAYEIGPYVLGMPSVVIPYGKMKPYLTDEVKSLLGME